MRFTTDRWPRDLDPHKLVFSAKEAFYKAYHSLTGVFLDFLDVEVTFSHGGIRSGAFRVRIRVDDVPLAAIAHQFAGRWLYDGSRVYTGVVLPSRSSSEWVENLFPSADKSVMQPGQIPGQGLFMGTRARATSRAPS
jgi:hypothetical protein